MTRPHPIKAVRFTEQFRSFYKKAPPEIQKAAKEAIAELVCDPHPKRYRLEKQTVSVWTIHVTRNHAYKLSFSLDGDTAVLRKIGTHKEIDRSP